jgi:hypothetical protein
MSALLTLTRREIVERRPLLWGTLAAALLPILARLQPWLRPELRRDWHEGLALIFGITFPIALAIGLGASVIGEDLAQRRLGFYFSRPLSGWSIWASKTLAAILITLGTVAAFVLPVALLSDVRPSAMLGDLIRKSPDWFLPWIAGLVGLILVAQAAAGAYRARDGLFALDIGALALLVAMGAGLVSRLNAAGVFLFSPELGHSTGERLVAPVLLVVAATAAIAAAMQVIVGRTDARRGHLALSTILWGTLAAGLLCAAGFTSWVLSVTPQDVGALPWGIRATSSGSHVAFFARQGRLDYRPMFLVDTTTGRFDRIPTARLRGFAFSADGRRAVWIEDSDPPTLALRLLDTPESAVRRSTLSAGTAPWLAALSDDGRQALLASQERIVVVDTDSGREAASASLDQLGADARSPVSYSFWSFVGDTVVGFFPSRGLPLVISTFAFRTGRITAGPKVDGVDWVRQVRDGRALLMGVMGRGPVVVVDGAKAHVLVAGHGLLGTAMLLGEDRVAALVNRESDRRLVVWNREGQPTLDVPFPAGVSVVAGEPRPGWLALAADLGHPARTVFVDLATGAVIREEAGLTPAAAWNGEQSLPPGSPGARLFVGTRGEIVRLDPETGRREAILVPPGAESELGSPERPISASPAASPTPETPGAGGTTGSRAPGR